MSWWNENIDDREALKKVENKKKKVLENDRKLYLKFLEQQYVRVSVLEDIISLPKQQEQIRLVTQQNFNAFAIFLYIIKNKNIREVYLTTYSIDKNTVEGLLKIFEKEDFKLTILIASLIKHDKPLLREKLMLLAKQNKNVSFTEAYNHTKIIAVRTDKNDYYVIEGSGNLSNNARIESYMFENNKQSFDFHKSWINDILNGKKESLILQSKNCINIK